MDAQQAIRLVRLGPRNGESIRRRLASSGFQRAPSSPLRPPSFTSSSRKPMAAPVIRWLASARGRTLPSSFIQDRRHMRAMRPPPSRRHAPPTFIATAGSGDAIHAVWAMEYFSAMLAARIPNVEMHVYGNGRARLTAEHVTGRSHGPLDGSAILVSREARRGNESRQRLGSPRRRPATTGPRRRQRRTRRTRHNAALTCFQRRDAAKTLILHFAFPARVRLGVRGCANVQEFLYADLRIRVSRMHTPLRGYRADERVTRLSILPVRQPRAPHLVVCRRCARDAEQGPQRDPENEREGLERQGVGRLRVRQEAPTRVGG